MITYTGLKNNRPTFDGFDAAPPKWLREAQWEVRDGELYARGRKIAVGDEVREGEV